MASTQPTNQKTNFDIYTKNIVKRKLKKYSIEKHILLNFMNLSTIFLKNAL